MQADNVMLPACSILITPPRPCGTGICASPNTSSRSRVEATPIPSKFSRATLGPSAPALEQPLEVGPLGVELAGRRQILHLAVGVDEVQVGTAVSPSSIPASVRALDHGDRAQFLDQARVEADLVHPVDDVAGDLGSSWRTIGLICTTTMSGVVRLSTSG